jgi:hypothetical protein
MEAEAAVAPVLITFKSGHIGSQNSNRANVGEAILPYTILAVAGSKIVCAGVLNRLLARHSLSPVKISREPLSDIAMRPSRHACCWNQSQSVITLHDLGQSQETELVTVVT